MKSVTFENSRQKTLVGHLYSASPDTIVIMAPGFCSDKSSQGRFDVFARRFNTSDISAIAIDFSGCGESDDDTLTVDKQVNDLQATIDWAQSQGYQKIGLYGHSLGGLICLKTYSPLIKTIAMTGGLTGPFKVDWNTHFSAAQMQELQEKGHLTESNARNMSRLHVLVDKQLLKDFESVDQKQVLSNVKCPVLLAHGDGDAEEKHLYQLSQMGLPYLPPTSELKVIAGAGHAFWGYIDDVADLLADWFSKKLA